MNAALVVAAIIGIFFVVGVVVGAIMVIALPVLRAARLRRPQPDDPGEGFTPRGHGPGNPDVRADQDDAAQGDHRQLP